MLVERQFWQNEPLVPTSGKGSLAERTQSQVTGALANGKECGVGGQADAFCGLEVHKQSSMRLADFGPNDR